MSVSNCSARIFAEWAPVLLVQLLLVRGTALGHAGGWHRCQRITLLVSSGSNLAVTYVAECTQHTIRQPDLFLQHVT